MDGVAPDGSPVAIYLALPAQPDLDRVRSVLAEGDSVLDLGTGVGRLANPLAQAGHRVVAVDDSAEMLEHLDGPTPVLADIWTLDLGERFGTVLALSHLVNHRSREARLQLLRVCRRHLADDGRVVVQRYAPSWVPAEREGRAGEIGIRLHDVVDHGDWFAAAVTYTRAGKTWTQRFESSIVDDDELASLAAATGLDVGETLVDDGSWLVLSPRCSDAARVC